jgi:hypothetical protein
MKPKKGDIFDLDNDLCYIYKQPMNDEVWMIANDLLDSTWGRQYDYLYLFENETYKFYTDIFRDEG